MIKRILAFISVLSEESRNRKGNVANTKLTYDVSSALGDAYSLAVKLWKISMQVCESFGINGMNLMVSASILERQKRGLKIISGKELCLALNGAV